jgi:hypothetical protein
MSNPRDTMFSYVQSQIPNIKPSTANSYTSVVKQLLTFIYEKQGSAPETIDFDILRNKTYIEEYIASYEKKYKKPMPETSRRNIYSILMRLFPDIQSYKHEFTAAVNEVKSRDTQEMTEKEKENWLNFEDVQKVYDYEYDKYRPILKSKGIATNDELSDISNFILLAVTSGIHIPPRRSQDWTEMKISNYTPTDNYYKGGKFYFNTYKTAGTYGTQIIAAPRKLKEIMKLYIAKNPHDYLLVNHFGKKLFETSLPPRLNKMFGGKKISTTMLRHIYLSHYHKDTPDLRDMTQLAHDMGHSVAMGLEYVRR